MIGFFDCCRLKAKTEAKGNEKIQENFRGRSVIVYNAKKGAKALIDNRLED